MRLDEIVPAIAGMIEHCADIAVLACYSEHPVLN